MISTPCTCNRIHVLCRDEDLFLSAEVARSLLFSPGLLEIADRVVQKIIDGGTRGFNGLHLRLEGDAVAKWMVKPGGIEVCL